MLFYFLPEAFDGHCTWQGSRGHKRYLFLNCSPGAMCEPVEPLGHIYSMTAMERLFSVAPQSLGFRLSLPTLPGSDSNMMLLLLPQPTVVYRPSRKNQATAFDKLSEPRQGSGTQILVCARVCVLGSTLVQLGCSVKMPGLPVHMLTSPCLTTCH